MNHQDWDPVILTKKTKPNPIITPKKPKEDEEFDIPKINADLKNKIQQGRIAKKLSQKALATQLSIPVKIIVEYENGKAIPNNEFIAKLERFLNIKLPRIKK